MGASDIHFYTHMTTGDQKTYSIVKHIARVALAFFRRVPGAFGVAGGVALGGLVLFQVATPSLFSVSYDADDFTASVVEIPAIDEPPAVPVFVVTHKETPESVRAIYMTSWIAGTRDLREERIVKLIDETELNAVVMDIKDSTGRIAFEVSDPVLRSVGSVEERIRGIKEFIGYLHDKDIYVIGRVAVFQDAYLSAHRPELAVKRRSDGGVWKDRKGISWLDAGNKEVWDYIVAISKEAYSVGFDEINFDYIRFPSDGNMSDIYYPASNARLVADPNLGKPLIMRDFFAYLRSALADVPMPISADIFGMTTTNTDDLNIGQILEYVAPYFDYIAPMVYPSHYPSGWNGFADVNAHPYEIVNISMQTARDRLIAATSTAKLRPWLQDNDYPVHYTPEMVRAQIQATYDAGVNSWMLWDAGNTYTRSALLAE